uniref:BCAS3 domain-containing protein n=1 Tax=Rhabditophanes sp. KR3021 TaxID=114890 RepID=A0AC35TN48_9BILA
MTSKGGKKGAKKNSVKTPAAVEKVIDTSIKVDQGNGHDMFDPLDDRNLAMLSPSKIDWIDHEDVVDGESFLEAAVGQNGSPANYNYQRSSNENSVKGRRVKPQQATESTFLSSVAETVTEVFPQNQSSSQTTNEQVLWVKIEKYKFDLKGSTTSHVIIFGLARGYQIWIVLDNGDVEEIVSERQGPLKIGHLLPYYPEPLYSSINSIDRFAEARPLMAMVEAYSPTPDIQFCHISFMSFITAKIILKIDFDAPICDVQSSSKCVLVLFANRITILDQLTLSVQHNINNITIGNVLTTANTTDLAGCLPAVAITGTFVAYVDQSLNKDFQSVGGAVIPDDSNSYSSQVLSATTKTISKTMGYFTGTGSNAKSAPKTINNQFGVVTIIDVAKMSPIDATVQKASDYTIAHFVAHVEPIGFVAFAPGTSLLVTSPISSTAFNLFNINIHPSSCVLTNVEHLYTLTRGSSSAKVIDYSFSQDSRWLLITTNHETSHLFAINSYGGPVTHRTHSGILVNKESKFSVTSGMLNHSAAIVSRTKQTLANTYKEHPSYLRHGNVTKTVINPRVQPISLPIPLATSAKIKTKLFSAESISTWTTDNTFIDLAAMSKTSKGGGESFARKFDNYRKIATQFVTSFKHQNQDVKNEKNVQHFTNLNQSLLVANVDGTLTEYVMYLQEETNHSNSSSASASYNPLSEYFSSSPKSTTLNFITQAISGDQKSSAQNNRIHLDPTLKIEATPTMQWLLQRKKSCVDVRLPLHENNPFYSKLMAIKYGKKEVKRPDSSHIAEWHQNIEATSYSGPHRRIWLGPQFTFGNIVSSNQHSAVDLYNPKNESNNGSGSHKSIPIVFSKDNSKTGYNINGEKIQDMATASIVCSSSFVYNKSANSYSKEVQDSLEEAMRELPPKKYRVEQEVRTESRTLHHSSASSSDHSLSDGVGDLSQMDM